MYFFGIKLSKGNGDLIYIELKNPIKNVEIAPLITNECEMVLTEEPSIEETIMPEVEYYTSEEETN